MRTKSIFVVATATFLFFPIGSQNVEANMYFSDGETHTINFTINDEVRVYNSPSDYPTTVNLVTGGEINYHFHVYDSSQASISGGSIAGHTGAYDNSQISISGGSIGGDFVARSSGQISISGGWIDGGWYAFDDSQVSISGGTVDGGLAAWGSSQASISGGSIAGEVHVFENSQVIISGGTLCGNLLVHHSSQITIKGSEFNYPYGTLTGSGLLTGILASGDMINRYFQTFDDARIVLVPAPSAILLGSIGITFSGWLLRRRRML
ncbi:MAG: hypothetical protein ABIL62_12600 [Planctomycetota bacterium]